MKLPFEHSLAAIREMYSTVKILCQDEKSKQILGRGKMGAGRFVTLGGLKLRGKWRIMKPLGD
jgi:hypothetical protein